MRFRLKNNVGKVHIRLDGKTKSIIRRGQVIDVDPKRIAHLMDSFEALDPVVATPPDATPKASLEIVQRPNSAIWYDVINPQTGKPINTKALKKAEAEELAGHEYIPPQSAEGGDDKGNHGDGAGGGGTND